MKDITVYIVEDYKLTRTTYVHYFSAINGISVTGVFENAEDCLAAMKKQQADIILMDLGLPNMNGIEATKLIASQYQSSKVIILTSHDDNEQIFASFATGASAYVLKDIELDELVEVIKNVHKGVVWIDPKIAEIVRTAFPKPNTTEDFDKLYDKPNLNAELTDKERLVLELMVKGLSNIEIADAIHVSKHTAKAYVCKILSKLAVTDRVQASVKAVKFKLY